MSGSVRGRVCCRRRVCASLLQTPSLRVRPGWKPLDAMGKVLSRGAPAPWAPSSECICDPEGSKALPAPVWCSSCPPAPQDSSRGPSAFSWVGCPPSGAAAAPSEASHGVQRLELSGTSAKPARRTHTRQASAGNASQATRKVACAHPTEPVGMHCVSLRACTCEALLVSLYLADRGLVEVGRGLER